MREKEKARGRINLKKKEKKRDGGSDGLEDKLKKITKRKSGKKK